VIVIEASAVVDALVGERANTELLAVMAEGDMQAPSLLDYEVASALRGHALAGRLEMQGLVEAVDDFGALGIDRYPLASMMRPVLSIRGNFTVYDAAYVVLAQALEAPLVTADAKLLEARRLGVDVRVFSPRG
jgi:predicted nucleic acid-binding protein